MVLALTNVDVIVTVDVDDEPQGDAFVRASNQQTPPVTRSAVEQFTQLFLRPVDVLSLTGREVFACSVLVKRDH